MAINVFWRSARCSRKEKNRNNVIREKMNIKNSVLDYMRYKQLNWYGQVRRMNKERLLKKLNRVHQFVCVCVCVLINVYER